MKTYAFFLILICHLALLNPIFSQKNLSCTELSDKISTAFKNKKTYRVSTSPQFGFQNFGYEVDSNSNSHYFYRAFKDKVDNYCSIIKIGDSIYSAEGRFLPQSKSDWYNSKHELSENINVSDSLEQFKIPSNASFSSCKFLKETKSDSDTYSVYSSMIGKDFLFVWIATSTNEVVSILQKSGETSKNWYFNIPFKTIKPTDFPDNKNSLILNFFMPFYSFKENLDNTEIYFNYIEKEPEYEGGMKMLFKFLSENLRYPADSRRNGEVGTVFVGFMINKDGSVDDIKIKKGVSPTLNAEALRVVKLMKKWIPGEVNGKKVRTSYTLPMRFRFG